MYELITINAGHNKHVQGANSNYGKEHEEARKVAAAVIKELKNRGQKVVDTTCNDHKTASSILKHQVDQCNKRPKAKRLDVSIHFNAFNGNANGVEVLYYSAKSLAAKVSSAIAKAGGFTDRGAKERKGLHFLKSTNATAILIEVCFIDNKSDMDKYRKNFAKIVNSIVDSITNKKGVLSVSQAEKINKRIDALEKENASLKKQLENKVDKPDNQNVSDWADEYWKRAVSHGYFDGTNPKNPLTREQAAKVVNSLVDNLREYDIKPLANRLKALENGQDQE